MQFIRKIKHALGVIICLTGTAFLCQGQDFDSKVSNEVFQDVKVRYHYGLVVPHHSYMTYFINDFSRGMEVNYGYINYGDDGWQKWYNFPEVGLSFFYNSFGNPDIYGQGMALYPYINFNILRRSRLNISHRVSLGLGYANKPFNLENNIYNRIFGTHLNVFIGFGLQFNYRIHPKWGITSAVALNHMSNGSSRKPNHGVNTMTGSIGVSYQFNEQPWKTYQKAKAPRENGCDVVAVLSMGRSQGSVGNPTIYTSGSLNLTHLWHRSAKTAWGAGVDLIYFGAAPFAYNEEVEQYNKSDGYQGGVFAAYEVYMGRTSIFMNIGAYVYHQISLPQPVYPRLGIRHQVTNNILANFSIKASFFKAEFIEFGLGYRWNYKKNQCQ